MPLLYDRSIRIEVGDEEIAAVFTEPLFLTVSITKYLSEASGQGTVQIYNADEAREAFIKERAERIRVLAGYGDPILLYDGTIRKVERDRAGNDRIANITLSADIFNSSLALINRSYQGATPIRRIIADAIADAGANATGVSDLPSDTIDDFAFVGSLKSLFAKVLPPIGYEVYEDLGIYRFSRIGEADMRSVVVLNVDSGLDGNPSVTDKGVKYTSRMNGLITAGSVVQIESEILENNIRPGRPGEYTGLFKNIQISHVGDNRTGSFKTEGLAVPI